MPKLNLCTVTYLGRWLNGIKAMTAMKVISVKCEWEGWVHREIKSDRG